jgi:hypothetical protein
MYNETLKAPVRNPLPGNQNMPVPNNLPHVPNRLNQTDSGTSPPGGMQQPVPGGQAQGPLAFMSNSKGKLGQAWINTLMKAMQGQLQLSGGPAPAPETASTPEASTLQFLWHDQPPPQHGVMAGRFKAPRASSPYSNIAAFPGGGRF